MAHKSYYLIKRGKYYYYRFAEEKTYHSTGKSSKSAAHEYCTQLLKKRVLDTAGPQRRIRFGKFAEGFFDQDGEWVRTQHDSDYSFGPNQSEVRNGHLSNYVIPKFGRRWMDSVEAYEVRKWLQSLLLANGTKNAIISTLNLVFAEARFQKYVKENPMRDVKRFSKKYRERYALSLEDIHVLFPKSMEDMLEVWKQPKWAVLYYTMLTTGLRRSEAAALQWRHVMWEKRGIVILQAVKAEKTVIGLPKNEDQRAVLLPARTLELLKWWHTETLFPDPEHFVFFGEWGDKNLYPDTITSNFNKGIKRLEKGDKFARNGRIITVHSLRHTYNTRMERVLPGEILRYMLGHKSEDMTRRYLHADPEERLGQYLTVIDQLNGAWD